MSVRKRFPVRKHVFMQRVGRLLPHRIGQILKELGCTNKSGYRIWINPNQGNGLDLKVWKYNALVLVGEILNWSIVSVLSNKRCSSIISNLSIYNCHKVLIHTIPLSRSHWSKIRRNRIDTLKVGYQILPKRFYDFFKSKRQITRRKIDSRKTRIDITSKISKYIRKKNI